MPESGRTCQGGDVYAVDSCGTVGTLLGKAQRYMNDIKAEVNRSIELDDLTSAGLFGLMDAIDAFDMTRGVKFETYCVPRIRGAMLDELRSMDWVPRMGRGVWILAMVPRSRRADRKTLPSGNG